MRSSGRPWHLRLLPSLACVCLCLCAPRAAQARSASAAATVPDSLAVLRARMAAGRPGDPELAALAERIVARREGATPVRPAEAAEALEWLGRARLSRSDYVAADSIFRRALARHRSAARPDEHAIAGGLFWLGEAQRLRKRLAAAESTATGALAMVAALAPPDTALETRLRVMLGNVYAERGRTPDAVEQLSRAVSLAEALAQPDSLLLGQACRNLARAKTIAGDYAGADDAYARSVRVFEGALGPAHPELGTTLYLRAMLSSIRGDYVAQRRDAERALAIREQAFGPMHPAVAITSATLGGALRNLGDPRGALPYYERALAIARAAPRPNVFDLSLALSNLGAAHLAAGDGALALECLLESRALRAQAGGPGAGVSVWSGARLAQAYAATGALASARAVVDSAIALANAGDLADVAPDLADVHQVRGAIEYAWGRTAEAIAAYARAFAFSDSLVGLSSPHTLDALAALARVRAAGGRADEAWADAVRLEGASRDVQRSSARMLAEHEALGLERSRASGLDVMLALANEPVGRAAAARSQLADAVVRARLLVLDQLADERRALPRHAPELAGPLAELESARDALARAMVAALREDRALDSTVTAARERRERAERALAERSASFGQGQRRADAAFADIAAALPAGSALVSFVRHDPPFAGLREGPAADSLRAAGRRYSALVLRAGESVPRYVPLAVASRVEPAIARWVAACATPPPADAALARASERRCAALGAVVRALVWDPIAPSVRGATRVFLVPDGALHAVNFAALPRASGGYLIESPCTLHRLGAERDLLPWGDAAALGRGLLAVGGADFDRSALHAPPDDSTALRFPPLPYTLREASEVVGLWRRSRALDATDARLLTGAEAGEEAFTRAAPGRRVLHVATHGFALGADSRDSQAAAGTRGVGAVVTSADAATRAPRRAGALLPGLALAGANAFTSARASGRDDGFLTAEELTSLDLDGAEWAVLSACETGLSDPSAPEAVQGLERAFRRAGVRTVIVSLWAVDDEGTLAWMRALYGARLVDGADTATSVRAAGLAALRERRAKALDTHPFRWAAFVADGDWR